jgi:hypothetical protein
MAAVKPEVVISQLLDEIAMPFKQQPLRSNGNPYVFRVQELKDIIADLAGYNWARSLKMGAVKL